MKNNIQKVKLLISEGWGGTDEIPATWRDPRKPNSMPIKTAQAYAIAYRRMERRETHALRRAGWYHDPGYGWRHAHLSIDRPLSRGEAWASLYRQERKQWQSAPDPAPRH